jgi:hypothetical protein
MMDSVQMTELIASLDSVRPGKSGHRIRDRRLVVRSSGSVPDEEIEEVVKESSRIFREQLKENETK